MPKKILVVDDVLTERDAVARILRDAGYEVIEADSGNSAVPLVTSLMPDLVLMDLVMPNGDGFTATKRIRQNQATRLIPVVILSTKKQLSDKALAQQYGARAYMVKPTDRRTLLGVIHQVISGR